MAFPPCWRLTRSPPWCYVWVPGALRGPLGVSVVSWSPGGWSDPSPLRAHHVALPTPLPWIQNLPGLTSADLPPSTLVGPTPRPVLFNPKAMPDHTHSPCCPVNFPRGPHCWEALCSLVCLACWCLSSRLLHGCPTSESLSWCHHLLEQVSPGSSMPPLGLVHLSLEQDCLFKASTLALLTLVSPVPRVSGRGGCEELTSTQRTFADNVLLSQFPDP